MQYAFLKDVKEGEGPITHNFVFRVIGGRERGGKGPSRRYPSTYDPHPPSHRRSRVPVTGD